jgi:hypothetical protein
VDNFTRKSSVIKEKTIHLLSSFRTFKLKSDFDVETKETVEEMNDIFS